MSLDLGALTGSVVVGLPGVQACLLVSRDGLPLSAFPLGEERRVMEVWLRLAELGDAERGFVVIGGQMWAFSVRGFYGTVAVAAPSVRPGLLLDRRDRAGPPAPGTRRGAALCCRTATHPAQGAATRGGTVRDRPARPRGGPAGQAGARPALPQRAGAG